MAKRPQGALDRRGPALHWWPRPQVGLARARCRHRDRQLQSPVGGPMRWCASTGSTPWQSPTGYATCGCPRGWCGVLPTGSRSCRTGTGCHGTSDEPPSGAAATPLRRRCSTCCLAPPPDCSPSWRGSRPVPGRGPRRHRRGARQRRPRRLARPCRAGWGLPGVTVVLGVAQRRPSSAGASAGGARRARPTA
jgi:hypothetical protein